MKTQLTSKDLPQLDVELAVYFACEGDTAPRGVADVGLRRLLAKQMKLDGFRGRAGDRLVWNAGTPHRPRRFAVIGLGVEDGAAELRIGAARAARTAEELSASRLALRVDGGSGTPAERVRPLAEGARLGTYRFDRHLTDRDRQPHVIDRLMLSTAGSTAGLKVGLGRAEAGSLAVSLARDLVNEAPSRMTPAVLARQAARAAKAAGLRCNVLTPDALRRAGLTALLAVARGSSEGARVVHLTYRPKTKARGARKVLLVGKGVTFDSGGLNLKLGDSMATMKADMGGAAAVLGAMTGLGALGCRHEVHAYLGLVENMPSGTSYKPGDVLNTWLGKTVEVGNTDAEGRLVLCDLLAYGSAKLKPTHVVDLATLTGACVVALGLRASGLFTRHDELCGELLCAAAGGGERMWPMPMWDDYLAGMQRGPADLCNIAGRWGGAITAALFLGEFVPRDVPWAHLDIAGPAFAEEDTPEARLGGTGAGVMTLLRWLEGA